MDLKKREFIGIISGLILMFVPSYSDISGHGIAQEFSLYFPWVTIIYIRPFTDATPSHMRFLPLFVTLIISIPSFYILKYIFEFMKEDSDHVEVSLKIVGYSFIQIIVILSSFLSLEPGIPESRFFLPIPYYLFILFYGGLSAKLYFTEGYQKSLQPYEEEVES